MNIELAKTIPMSEFLRKQGFEPAKTKGHDLFYLSPLRNEKTPSFHVHTGKNVWYDHGEGKGGDLVSYVCEYLKTQNAGHMVSDALRYIKNIGGYAPHIKPVPVESHKDEDSALKLKSDREIQHAGLIAYLSDRGIPLTVGRMYLRQLYVHNANSGKDFYTLGIRNEKKGFELRNLYFKGSLGKKYYTFIRGSKHKPASVNIFEGFMDYLSIITQREGKPFEGDTIILNSLVTMERSIELILNYGYETGYTWLDNDEPGKKATIAFGEFFKAEGLQHKPMNSSYAPYKDVNAHHMVRLGLNS
jgi:hypothetical protein